MMPSLIASKGKEMRENVIMDVDVSARRVIAIGCVVAGVGVAAGAFGAHMLKTLLEPPMLAAYDTGTRYQMYHAFGMILSGMGARVFRDHRLVKAGWFFAAGLVLFCGSLYGMALLEWRWLGPITPIGGLTFIAGWLLLAWRTWHGMQPRGE
ncbi:conserved membrane protein of unknown function [Candidatus Nitrospira inopinata]|uniref:DUF423 domain-containing protein n=2 Tax=Candidatus Nitrospira inopinata TaxID=1715989 RepID=A0A0S4KZC9_9BACT|nr:conserved membrane protein of unknown function [Candidatus Nitrospira inopinata]